MTGRRASTNPAPDVLADADTFTGAACAGRWEVWCPGDTPEEPADTVYRTARARVLCGTCPCLAACTALVATIPARDRAGVWAGVAYGQPFHGRVAS